MPRFSTDELVPRPIKLAVAAAAIAATLSATDVSEQAAKLHREALVFDGHVHIANRQFHQGGNIGDRYPDGQVDLPRMREGGLDALFFSIYVSEAYYPGRYETKYVLRLLEFAREQIEKHSDQIELALTASDVERIARAGKIAAFLDLEGGFDLDGDLNVLRGLYRLGLRSAQLPAHNWTNEFADSCCSPKKWGGLNERGREVIREMNRLGMVINISHASDEATEQAIAASADPIVATHHGLRSFNDIPRVMPEALLRKLAAKGGVIGFHIGHSFHNPKYHAWRTKRSGRALWDTTGIGHGEAVLSLAELDARAAKSYPSVGPTPPDELFMSVDQWFDVVDRAIELVGEDHVALGSDFDGGPTPPRGMTGIDDLPILTEAMLRRGYSETRIRKFLGGNWMRVLRHITEN